MEKKKVLVCDWYKLGLHPYSVKNPKRVRISVAVHMIEGGEYITEDPTIFSEYGSDMGWFQLTKPEYEIMQQNLEEIELEIR